MSKTYKLSVGCYNCFHKWTKTVPFGKDVDEGAVITYLQIGMDKVSCPNCGSSKTHKIHG